MPRIPDVPFVEGDTDIFASDGAGVDQATHIGQGEAAILFPGNDASAKKRVERGVNKLPKITATAIIEKTLQCGMVDMERHVVEVVFVGGGHEAFVPLLGIGS